MRILSKYILAVFFWILLSAGFTASLFLSEIHILQREQQSLLLQDHSALAQQMFENSYTARQDKIKTKKLLSNIKKKLHSDIVLWNPEQQILSTFSPLLHNKVALLLRDSIPDKNDLYIKIPLEKLRLQFNKSASKNIWIGVAISTDSDYGMSGPVFIKFIFSTLLFILLAGLTIYIITRSILRPVREMTETLSSAESGKLNPIPEINRSDEIQSLVFQFNRYAADLSELLSTQHKREVVLSKKLQESQSKFVKLTDNLERVVARRTAELREKDAQLLQTGKLAGLGELSSGIAHEINQPLNIIKLIVTGMMRQYSIKKTLNVDEVVKELNTINQQTIRVHKIIGHMKSFARKRTNITFTEININDPINDSMLLIGRQLEDHNVHLKLELDESLPAINGDAIQLEQILINLINNARDAVEIKEAALLQKGHREYEKIISVKTCLCEESVCVEIADNGCGMTDEIRQKIFEPFYSTKGKKGTGMGMPITYNIVKNLKGEISVSSELAVGTTFTISFPAIKTDTEKETEKFTS